MSKRTRRFLIDSEDPPITSLPNRLTATTSLQNTVDAFMKLSTLTLQVYNYVAIFSTQRQSKSYTQALKKSSTTSHDDADASLLLQEYATVGRTVATCVRWINVHSSAIRVALLELAYGKPTGAAHCRLIIKTEGKFYLYEPFCLGSVPTSLSDCLPNLKRAWMAATRRPLHFIMGTASPSNECRQICFDFVRSCAENPKVLSDAINTATVLKRY